jgi:mannose-1-phosphate guanylyltransferase
MSESDTSSRWGLILAGGDGTRLRSLTRRIVQDERPKQFCPVLSKETLLEQTLRRAALLVSPDRTLAVVVRAHERFYAPLLADLPPRCMVIQPENRGTAPAILYGLLRLTSMAPGGPVAIFPSDHYVSDDAAFIAHVDGALQAVIARPDLVVLLGITPDSADVEYGWIEPGDPIMGSSPWDLRRVSQFWEKPSPRVAQTLRARGCLWNSFVMVAYPSALLTVIESAVPALFDAFAPVRSRLATPWEDDSLRRVYARLPSMDFSKQVLATCPTNLAVLALDGVGWNDLGAPRRVMATLARTGARPAWSRLEERQSA